LQPAAQTPPAALPPASTSQAAAVDLTTPATPAESGDRPIYKKWWFWAGAAGAVVILGGIAAANAKKEPSPVLGIYQPTWDK
jgi:hypothetical protein